MPSPDQNVRRLADLSRHRGIIAQAKRLLAEATQRGDGLAAAAIRRSIHIHTAQERRLLGLLNKQ